MDVLVPPPDPSAAVAILESIGDALVLLDENFRFAYVNAEAERLLGIPRAELIGKTQGEAFPAILGSSLEENYRRVIAERRPITFENFHEPSNRWYEIRAYPAPNGGAAIHFQDVTERKRVEAVVDRTKAVLENMGEAILELDSDFRFTFIN